MRERDTRAFFFALKAIAEEKQRCERVLGLLLPPTLVAAQRAVIIRAAALTGGDSCDSLGTGASIAEREMQSVVSVGGERFAEAFDSASILFAEGKGCLPQRSAPPPASLLCTRALRCFRSPYRFMRYA